VPRGTWFWLVAFLAALMLPLVNGGDYFLGVCVLFAIYASTNLMWSLVLGTAGIPSFATLAIVGTSAYAAAYLADKHDVGILLTIPVATVVGALAGVLVAAPAIRLRGIYFALFTLGLAELCRSVVLQSQSLGETLGLSTVHGLIPDTVSVDLAPFLEYYVAFGLLIAALVVHAVVQRGRLGLLLTTARESEPVAQAMGIDIARVRLAVFLVSSAALGLIGGFYAAFYRGVSPSIFDFDLLLLLLAMTVVGGIDSRRGILAGTALLLFIDQHFLESGPDRLVAIGVIMLVITLLAPDGLGGVPAQLRRLVTRSRGVAWAPAVEAEPPGSRGTR
jgi:branched-chain amino acid transport system permease protein